VQNERQAQALAAWEQTVLTAVKEVRDALMDYAKEQERYQYLQRAEEAAQNALDISKDKYQNGLTDFNNVLDAQKSQLSFQEQLALSKGRISMNLVRVYKALGGGWAPMAECAEGEDEQVEPVEPSEPVEPALKLSMTTPHLSTPSPRPAPRHLTITPPTSPPAREPGRRPPLTSQVDMELRQ